MTWIYRLQQRVAITGPECAALLAAVLALAAGLGVRYVQSRAAPDVTALYASDAQFAALDRAAETGWPVPSATASPAAASADTTLALAEAGTAGADTAATPTAAVALGPAEVADAPRRRSSSREAAPAPMSLNTADAATLEGLPGIGPALAARIVEYRRLNGPFRRVDDVVDVKGIGPKTLEKMRPYLHL